MSEPAPSIANQSGQQERRDGPRRPEDISIVLRHEDHQIAARITDQSPRGFRVMHWGEFRIGETILVVTESREVSAKVVWMARTQDGMTVSGLKVLG